MLKENLKIYLKKLKMNLIFFWQAVKVFSKSIMLKFKHTVWVYKLLIE